MSKPVFGFTGFSLAQVKKPKLSAFGDDDLKTTKPKETKETAPAAVRSFFFDDVSIHGARRSRMRLIPLMPLWLVFRLK